MGITQSKQNLVMGDSVTFTCGTVTGATRYEFRVRFADGTFQNITPSDTSANVSTAFTITKKGRHHVQCRPCQGADAASCNAYDSLTQ
jgi:hypothetical protein